MNLEFKVLTLPVLTRSVFNQLKYFDPENHGVTRTNYEQVRPVCTVLVYNEEWVLFETPTGMEKLTEYTNRGYDRVWGSPNKLPRVVFTQK